MKPVNRFYTDDHGNRCEISAEELQAERDRLNAKPEHQEFMKTGIRSGTDLLVNGVVTIRSRKLRELGKVDHEVYKRLIAAVGVEEARDLIVCEGQYGVDWDNYIRRLQVLADKI